MNDNRSQELASKLSKEIQGEVRFDEGSRALYSTDASNYRQIPIGVVLPKDVNDVVATMEIARRYDAPVLARGGGTSLAGQCCNVAIVIDTSKYLNRILSIDPEKLTADVEPGVVLDRLRDAAEQHHLTFGPDPATHNQCTLGGMIGNNSCGVHSVYAGKTVDNIEELDILTYRGERMTVSRTPDKQLEQLIESRSTQGEIYGRLKSLRDQYASLIRQRYPKIPRRVSGYNLDELLPENEFHVARALVGTESTCVFVLRAKVRLVHSPPARTLVVLGFVDVMAAADYVPELLEFRPLGLEGIDDQLVNAINRKRLHTKNLKLLPSGAAWLLVEFGGNTKSEADTTAGNLIDFFSRKSAPPSMKIMKDRQEELMVWEIRESALGATAFVPGEPRTWEGWEDAAVPPEKLGPYLRDFRALLNKYEYGGSFYGHFGQGCVHTRTDFDLTSEEGIKKFRLFLEEAADLVLSYGGSLSGEHGDGQSRGELLPKMFGPELVGAFEEFKTIWDPDWKMNPGKVVRPNRITDNLRLGIDYHPAPEQTHFHYPQEHGFANAILRCVGVGKCRRTVGGTMCPSYVATMEEKHSTRGRARLLFEMMQGDSISGGWRDEQVKDALDLCLACKGCKHECPVEVDMATYKAEFFSHYYKRRLRPASAYSMGLIYWWSRAASLAPGMVNFFTQNPLFSNVMKIAGGIAPDRRIPTFAGESFRKWFQKRSMNKEKGERVLLWPDTFNNFFHPETARAAVEVLEYAGFRVDIPPRILCCGRPLYDFGMLDLAKKMLLQILEVLRPEIRKGAPVIFLEPSCLTVIRDELTNLFPHDQDASRLAQQSFLLSEFLDRNEGAIPLPKINGRALLHVHCHQKSILGTASEEELLSRSGLDFSLLDSGCCGMAGSFGFEKEKYDVSVRIGERVLLPAVRNASPDTLIVTSGFSCREQISQHTDRRAIHPAELLQRALSSERS